MKVSLHRPVGLAAFLFLPCFVGCGGSSNESAEIDEPQPELALAIPKQNVIALEAEGGEDNENSDVQMSDGAFRLAAEKGRVEKVVAALKSGFDADTVDPATQFTALHLAAHEGHLAVVKALIAHDATVDRRAQNDLTPLHLAAYNGHTEVVEWLLESGAKVDARDREGKTSLTHACTGDFPKTAKLLIESGADINSRESSEGFTPLMMAAGLGELEVVKVLLRNDADKTIKDEDGDTALSHAQTKGYVDIIKLLE